MNPKTKSILYFATFVLAFIIYSNIRQDNNTERYELAENTVESTLTQEALN